MATPVVLIVFNRPDTTAKVFERIAAAQPEKLIVICDGPRSGRLDDEKKIRESLSIATAASWPCSIDLQISDVNLGCGMRIKTGLDYVFSSNEDAIILEDDCLPHVDFFNFSHHLLQRYANDERIGIISGSNFCEAKSDSTSSYFFSRYAFIWGWASWRRVWELNDFDMVTLNASLMEKRFDDVFVNRSLAAVWSVFMSDFTSKAKRTWDYQFMYSTLVQSMLHVVPSRNMIRNIGCDRPDATQAQIPLPHGNIEEHGLNFPLSHPSFVGPRLAFDEAVAQKVWSIPVHVFGARKFNQNAIEAEHAFSRATSLYQRGEIAAAESELRSGISLDRHHANSLNLYGIVNHRLGRRPVAEAAFLWSMIADPDNPAPFINMSVLFEEAGQIDTAISMMTCAVALNRHNVQALARLEQLNERVKPS